MNSLALGLLASSATLFYGVSAGFNPASSNHIAVYWGQNSVNEASGPFAQQRLATYCENTDIDIIPISFLLGMKSPLVNFANQEYGCQPIAGSSLIYCPQIEEDIKTCQDIHGKKILISVGGATYTEGGFSSPAEAISSAEQVWSWFGPPTNGPRPFGSAVLDGFDFDLESAASNIVPFARRLRQLGDASGRELILTAAPQCPYPDYAVGELLASDVKLDAIMVQFYNNYCGMQSFIPGSDTQNFFNFATWDDWAKTVSANPNVKVMIGVPGNARGAGSGYAPANLVAAAIQYAKRFSSFGGVMVWDVTQAYSNGDFLLAIRAALGGAPAAYNAPPPPAPAPEAPAPTPAPAAAAPAPAPFLTFPDAETTLVTAITWETPVPVQWTPAPVPVEVAPVAPVSQNGVKAKEWMQCGGIGYTGPTECEDGLICVGHDWWYMCRKP